METQEYTDLVGILVGTIMVNSPPLVYYLYSDPLRRRHTRVAEFKPTTETHDAVQSLAESFDPVLVDVWCNQFYPCWYFLQVKEDWGPDRLGCFGLPWTVYFGWRKTLLSK